MYGQKSKTQMLEKCARRMGRQSLLDHPYFTKVLAVEKGGNNFVRKIVDTSYEERTKFLNLIASGFYPISLSSPQAFGRVSNVSEKKETEELAQFIYETELGLHPLIGKGASYFGTTHSQLYIQMMESLDNKMQIKMKIEWQLLKKLRASRSSLLQVLAYCEVIEGIAPESIQRIEEFVSQWQVLTGVPSSRINRIYLSEHELTEGDSDPHQHISIVSKMLEPYSKIAQSQGYRQAQEYYNYAVIKHLDLVYTDIEKLMNEVKS